MSISSSSHPEGQGYNSDSHSSSSPQISSSLNALAGSESSVPFQVTPLASKPPSSSRCPPQAKTVRADIHQCGSELSERDLVDPRSHYDIPSSVMLLCSRPTHCANALASGLRTFFVVSLREGLPQGVPFGFMAHPKSHGAIPRSAKHKVDAYAFSTLWEDKLPMPLHFYTDHHILKAEGLFPTTDADLGALEALRVSFSVPDHAPFPPPSAPAKAPDKRPLTSAAPALEPVVISSSSKEDEAMSPLPSKDAALEPPSIGTSTPPSPEGHLSSTSPLQSQSPLPPTTQVSGASLVDAGGQHSATIVLEPKDQGGVCLSAPQTPSSVSFQAPEPQPMSQALSPQGYSFPLRKRLGSLLASSRPSQLLKKSESTPPSSSPAAPNHAEMISSLSTLGDKFFGLHGVALRSYKELLSSCEMASGSSSRASQLEGELNALKKEKAREESVLQCRLKNLVSEHTIIHERYGASVQRTEAVRATLEGVHAERNSTMREKDVAMKERDSLRTGRDEMLQTHFRLRDQLTESQRQAQVMEATLEGARTTDVLEDLVQSSNTGRDLLFQHFSLALERTIVVV
ncbi:hypothetical protein LIER_08456 [Lithospermum erythrorhizon]|uniref:Uncharacterized protein n=1 Tax=Lithospermum erythrorhizon TaxID=34254 RepID=A0AAV3PBX3_LITER